MTITRDTPRETNICTTHPVKDRAFALAPVENDCYIDGIDTDLGLFDTLEEAVAEAERLAADHRRIAPNGLGDVEPLYCIVEIRPVRRVYLYPRKN